MMSEQNKKKGLFTLEKSFPYLITGLVGFVILGLNFAFYYCSLPSNENHSWTSIWWSNLGQSFGIAAAILSFVNILFIVYTLQQQNEYNKIQDIQNKNQDDNQRQKVEILKSQVQLTAQLSSLDVFVNTFKDRLDVRRKELADLERKVKRSQDEDDKILKLKSELKKLESSVENLRHEISDKYNSVEASEIKIPAKEFQKNLNEEIAEKIFQVCQAFSNHERVYVCAIIPEFILDKYKFLNRDRDKDKEDNDSFRFFKRHKSFFDECIIKCFSVDNAQEILDDIKQYFAGEKIKTKILEVCKEISIHEGIPACAIIPKDILDYLIKHFQNNPVERLAFLKYHKIFFAKWINDCFFDFETKDILDDVKHYYRIDSGMPYSRLNDRFLKRVYAILIGKLAKESNDFYGTKSDDGKYISNPYFHRSQVAQIACQFFEIKKNDDLINLKWELGSNNLNFNALSRLQSLQIVTTLIDPISHLQDYWRRKQIREIIFNFQKAPNIIFDKDQLADIAREINSEGIKCATQLHHLVKEGKREYFLRIKSNWKDIVKNLYAHVKNNIT